MEVKKRSNAPLRQRLVTCLLGILVLSFATASFSMLSLKKRIDNGSEATVTGKHCIAYIIDDIGYDIEPVHRLVHMGIPVTLSILPRCPYSRRAADEATCSGLEIMLHLPMEPHEYPEKNPGDGALFTHMTKGAIIDLMEEHIAAVPGIRGVNNHMGSHFMEGEEKLTVVFGELKKRGLFFIDSCTTSHSMGRRVAKKTGIGYASRDVFIDNNGRYRDTVDILTNIIQTRDRWHTLILIGHPYESTLEAMEQTIHRMKSAGITIVPVSSLVQRVF